jgi:hypothetical protein
MINMKVIDVPQDAIEILRLLEQAREGEIVLRTVDGREFTLAASDEYDEEIKRTRANSELLAFLEERAKEPATIPLADVKRELGLE